MHIHKNIHLNGSRGKPMLTDLFFTEGKSKPVVIYSHGFNGFKDWGNFDLIAKQFASAGFVIIKFNFSHNGTTIDAPEDFKDLNAFAENNYTKELDDLNYVIDWLYGDEFFFKDVIDIDKVFLLGHSMGGGISIIKAAEDARIKALVTWASIDECKTPWGNWTSSKIEDWQKEGTAYITNSRTNQEMPLYFQLYQDYFNNFERLDIKKAVQKLNIPLLLCHGKQDEAVAVETAYELNKLQPGSELFIIESNHVFGRKHPWTTEKLPIPMQEVLNKTIAFYSTQ